MMEVFGEKAKILAIWSQGNLGGTGTREGKTVSAATSRLKSRWVGGAEPCPQAA